MLSNCYFRKGNECKGNRAFKKIISSPIFIPLLYTSKPRLSTVFYTLSTQKPSVIFNLKKFYDVIFSISTQAVRKDFRSVFWLHGYDYNMDFFVFSTSFFSLKSTGVPLFSCLFFFLHNISITPLSYPFFRSFFKLIKQLLIKSPLCSKPSKNYLCSFLN